MITFVGSPEGSGYISTFLLSAVNLFGKSLKKSRISFPVSVVAKVRRDAQKYACAKIEDSDKSHCSSCSITWPLIWFRVNLDWILTIKSPPTMASGDLGFPLSVHLMLNKLVDNITISCTVCGQTQQRKHESSKIIQKLAVYLSDLRHLRWILFLVIFKVWHNYMTKWTLYIYRVFCSLWIKNLRRLCDQIILILKTMKKYQ